ncbi:MAG: ATP-dependent Clp protease proteolytic subunit [Deltaproteobacteria bacterium]|jgi:ATP-dependent Clp protease protease subunit|nr:ATP-dependent Clp protease proteolytic subunit [Deltaproteobacteria bacterium]
MDLINNLKLDVGAGHVVAAGDDDDKGNPKGGALEALKKTRTIELFGPVNGALAKKVIAQLFFLESEDPDKPITVLQNSPGGSVTDGFAIYDAMRFVKPEIKIVCIGLTASIATITLLGAKKENRLTLPNTEFLIHQPLIAGNVFGVASDLEITAKQILKTREIINEMLSRETGQPLDVVQRHTERDYWMNAQEALDYGLVSRIVTSRSEI